MFPLLRTVKVYCGCAPRERAVSTQTRTHARARTCTHDHTCVPPCACALAHTVGGWVGGWVRRPHLTGWPCGWVGGVGGWGNGLAEGVGLPSGRRWASSPCSQPGWVGSAIVFCFDFSSFFSFAGVFELILFRCVQL